MNLQNELPSTLESAINIPDTLSQLVSAVNLARPRVSWEEGTSAVELPRTDWSVGKSEER